MSASHCGTGVPNEHMSNTNAQGVGLKDDVVRSLYRYVYALSVPYGRPTRM